MSRNIKCNGAAGNFPERMAAASLPGASKPGAHHTLSVEAVMDLASAMLWPEPIAEQIAATLDADPDREYALLAMLLVRSPDATTVGRIADLRGDTMLLGRVHPIPAQAAPEPDAETNARDFPSLSSASRA